VYAHRPKVPVPLSQSRLQDEIKASLIERTTTKRIIDSAEGDRRLEGLSIYPWLE
jgi:hypothetical protein